MHFLNNATRSLEVYATLETVISRGGVGLAGRAVNWATTSAFVVRGAALMSITFGTNKRAKARFWSWLEPLQAKVFLKNPSSLGGGPRTR